MWKAVNTGGKSSQLHETLIMKGPDSGQGCVCVSVPQFPLGGVGASGGAGGQHQHKPFHPWGFLNLKQTERMLTLSAAHPLGGIQDP